MLKSKKPVKSYLGSLELLSSPYNTKKFIMENITNDLKTSVKNFILSNSFVDTSKLNDNTLIFREGYFDSMGFVSLLSFLEDNYQISIQDSDLIETNFESINSIVSFIGLRKDKS